MIKKIASYLGKPASAMLSDTPFKLWPFERSFEEDLEEPIVHYAFPSNGLELRCDGDEKVNTIFLYSEDSNRFDEGLLDVPFSASRQHMMDFLGLPAKSGGKVSDPILGEYGAWDRFALPGYDIHIEWKADADHVKMITLTNNNTRETTVSSD